MPTQPVYQHLDGLKVGILTNWLFNPITTANRLLYTLSTENEGLFVFDVDEDKGYIWDGNDWIEFGGSSGGGVTDHGALTGLADDDHPQYHNDARGDARYAQITHTHTKSQITDFDDADYAAAIHTHVKADITDFAHTHPQSDITNLVSDLAGKAPIVHTHVKADITDFSDGDYAASIHTHVKADVTDFAHTHVLSDITDYVAPTDTNWANTDLVFTDNRIHQQSGGTLSLQSVGHPDYPNSYLNNSADGFESYKQYGFTNYFSRIQQTISSTGGMVRLLGDTIYSPVSVTVNYSNVSTSNNVVLSTGNGSLTVGGTNFGTTFNGGLFLSASYQAGGYDTASPIYALALDSTGVISTIPVPVADAITNGVTNVAPSQNAVFDALALKLDDTYDDVANHTDNPFFKDLQALGSAIFAGSFGRTQYEVTTTTAAIDAQFRWCLIPLRKAATITNLSVWITVQGNYVADNYNGLGLYSVDPSTGLATLVASTTNDGTIFTASANAMLTRALSTPYVAAKGLYLGAVLYNNSSQTTAPSFGSIQAAQGANLYSSGLISSFKGVGLIGSQIALPATVAAGAGSVSTLPIWFGLS
jgi:Phage tail repeat like